MGTVSLSHTVSAAAAHLQVSKRSIYRLIASGELPAFKVRSSTRISTRALAEFIARSETRAVAKPTPSVPAAGNTTGVAEDKRETPEQSPERTAEQAAPARNLRPRRSRLDELIREAEEQVARQKHMNGRR